MFISSAPLHQPRGGETIFVPRVQIDFASPGSGGAGRCSAQTGTTRRDGAVDLHIPVTFTAPVLRPQPIRLESLRILSVIEGTSPQRLYTNSHSILCWIPEGPKQEKKRCEIL